MSSKPGSGCLHFTYLKRYVSIYSFSSYGLIVGQTDLC